MRYTYKISVATQNKQERSSRPLLKHVPLFLDRCPIIFLLRDETQSWRLKLLHHNSNILYSNYKHSNVNPTQLLLANLNHVIYFNQSQLLLAKTNEDLTMSRKVLLYIPYTNWHKLLTVIYVEGFSGFSSPKQN